jgi:hypothetical protein
VIHLVGRWLETAGSPLSEPESPFRGASLKSLRERPMTGL